MSITTPGREFDYDNAGDGLSLFAGTNNGREFRAHLDGGRNDVAGVAWVGFNGGGVVDGVVVGRTAWQLGLTPTRSGGWGIATRVDSRGLWVAHTCKGCQLVCLAVITICDFHGSSAHTTDAQV